LAGGAGKRLSLLTRYRAKPAVPFAGKYRIIDFTLTNCVRSGIEEIYVLTQYISRSLTRHIGIGKPWDLDRIEGGVSILHPHLGYEAADWYKSTADAFYQNISILKDLNCRNILILSGDHVYKADYREFLEFHERSGKPASVGVTEVPVSSCRHFGIATIDSEGTIKKFEEKPEKTSSNLASMGIYIFDRKFLISLLGELIDSCSDLDFGKHVIPNLTRRGLISAFNFSGYWLDIGTLRSYYNASMSLLAVRPKFKLCDYEAPVLSVPDDHPPLVVTKNAIIKRSLICNGCIIEGKVRSSILSPGVVVGRGAEIENSIIFHNCTIETGARIRNAIIDKHSVIGCKTSLGYGNPKISNKLHPSYLDFGIAVVGRETRIPAGIKIGTNCLVAGSKISRSIPANDIDDGGYYIAAEEIS